MNPLRKIELVPSLPAESFAEVTSLLTSLEHVSYGFQLDLVDGQFVSAAPSWPYNTDQDIEDELRHLVPYIKNYELEVDCMILSPACLFEVFRELSAKRLVLHYGSSTHLEDDISTAKQAGFMVSLGVLNNTPATSYEALLPLVDGVQVMGIAEIGKQGQPFDQRTLTTVARIAAAYPALSIAVDGSVNQHTIPLLLRAGATRLAPGSAIAKQPDPAAAYRNLLQLATSQQG